MIIVRSILRYVILQLFQEYETIMLVVIQAPTVCERDAHRLEYTRWPGAGSC